MKCPNCGFPIMVSRTEDYGTEIRRYRPCRMCKKKWYTIERVDNSAVKKRGRKPSKSG